uniref:EGF-like domain-containing protein n=1 Tax=Cyclophora tenuis TaxID=216820 RepID=A0A7S1DC34_CYCTE|mmetsp:Transcript_8978/g.15067  ORF Transcript_8978/g.15067 Transcript_8978/m.15067 type:complete len:316 (+) Transcript_8978:114-1061(+)
MKCISNLLFICIVATATKTAQANHDPSVDACQRDSECLNGGTCIIDNGGGISHSNTHTPSYCQCAAGHNGDNCENYCPRQCQNGGTCRYSPVAHAQGPSDADYECACRSGHKGAFCEISYVVCPDGLECLNGAQCISSKLDASIFTCDCPYTHQGLSCEVGLEVKVCADGTQCINGGVCRLSDATDELANVYECVCPDDHSGDFCEALEATSTAKRFGPNDGLSPGGVVGVVFAVFTGILIFAILFVMKKTVRVSKSKPRDASTAGADIDPDGSTTMKPVVNHSSNEQSTAETESRATEAPEENGDEGGDEKAIV